MSTLGLDSKNGYRNNIFLKNIRRERHFQRLKKDYLKAKSQVCSLEHNAAQEEIRKKARLEIIKKKRRQLTIQLGIILIISLILGYIIFRILSVPLY